MKKVYEESEMGLGPLRNIKLASFVFEDLRSMMIYTNNMVDDITILLIGTLPRGHFDPWKIRQTQN